jgi:porin
MLHYKNSNLRRYVSVLALSVSALGATCAHAQDAAESPWKLEATYTADVTGVLDGGPKQAGRFLDNLDIIVDGDLEKAWGWRGAVLHVYLLNNSGGQPNDRVGALQGVDNIEVSRPRGRLYEAWIEQSFAGGRATALAGLYDLNSEFYTTEASGLLIAPPFGIGSEIAASGPNGPSIFPSTSLSVRLKATGENGAYVQSALVNADAGTIGDPDGPNMRMDRGLLAIAEAGIGEGRRVAIGGWRYTREQDDIRDVTASGDPDRSTARGVYLLAEQPLVDGGESGRSATAFARMGLSDGETTVFAGGWQAGVLVERVFASRPDSAFSVGVEQGFLSDKGRANLTDQGLAAASAESSLEITYSDRIHPRVTLQPDLQVIRHTGGDRQAPTAIVGALRVTVSLK